MTRNEIPKLAPWRNFVVSGVVTGWNSSIRIAYSVFSPAQPSPRLASVTPICVTESRRPGLERRLSAACAPACPSSAICRSREETVDRDQQNHKQNSKWRVGHVIRDNSSEVCRRDAENNQSPASGHWAS